MRSCPYIASRIGRAVATLGLGLATAGLVAPLAWASSHREAPYLAGQPKLDATDLYMFRSYEPGRQDFVTVLANYMPFQDPQGAPTSICSTRTRCMKFTLTTAAMASKT